MSRSRVLLPHPDGPISDTNCPLSTVRSTSDSAVTSSGRPWLNTLLTPATDTAVMPPPPLRSGVGLT